jgi:hypothetical protein
MKVLIPCPKDYLSSNKRNPFVRFIYNGLIENGFEVVCDHHELWNDPLCYDAIFFQWPEAAFDWTDFDVLKIEQKLIDLRNKNIRIIATCHNLHSHNDNEDANKLYDILYSHSDAIHHLGYYSFEMFKAKYPNCHHFISQHPIFYDIKAMKLDKTECRDRLRLPANKKTILSFGEFRSDEEIRLLVSLRKRISCKNVIILAPRLPTGSIRNGLRIDKTIKCIRTRADYWLKKIYYKKVFIDDDMIPYYFTACDVVFIQRKDILNSGNLPLAFSAGRIVVGPDRGNVGDILKKCGNPCFDPNDTSDVINKTELALELSKSDDIGIKNYNYAHKYMKPHITNEIISKTITYLLTNKNVRAISDNSMK